MGGAITSNSFFSDYLQSVPVGIRPVFGVISDVTNPSELFSL